jgi:phospholipid/cholesterol/gamma-HCH transport system substrate-binding protein
MRKRPGHGISSRRAARESRRHTRAAVIAAVAIAVAFYAAFVKQVPFSSQFVLRGVFQSANQLKPGNPVRIAGLPVGTVTAVAPGPHDTSVVSMALDQTAGLHADATLSIEPRLLFEGNLYVDLHPGTPAAPALRSGETVPLARTTIPVQIDQVLDVLDFPTRYSLKHTLRAFADGLGGGAGSTPGYRGLRAAARELSAALPSVTRVAAAAQGTQSGDLPRAIDSSGAVTAQLSSNPAALANLVTSTDQVFRALSADDTALAESFGGLDRVVRIAPSSLTALDHALPTLRHFAVALDPSLHRAPGTLTDTSALFAQIRALVSPAELPRLQSALAPVIRHAPRLESRLRVMFPLLEHFASCASRNIVPTLDTVLQDGANTSNYPAWKDLLHLGAALSGGSASFDGNGVSLRIGTAEGSFTASSLLSGFGEATGRYQGEGVRPKWLGYGVIPPFRPDATCDQQPLPAVNAP